MPSFLMILNLIVAGINPIDQRNFDSSCEKNGGYVYKDTQYHTCAL